MCNVQLQILEFHSCIITKYWCHSQSSRKTLLSFVDSLITAVIQNEAEGKKEQRLSVEDAEDEDVFNEPEGFNSDLEGEVIEQVCQNGKVSLLKLKCTM